MKTPIRVLFTLFAVSTVLSGCATVGSGDFACPGRPTGVRCASAVEVYALTESTDQIEATADKALGDDPKKAVKDRQEQGTLVAKAEDEASGNYTRPVDVRGREPRHAPVPEMPRDTFDGRLLQASTGGSPIIPLVHKPIPVRTPAQVMRVWIAPWEDAKGVLHVGGYHFVEIEARRWTFGGQGQVQPVRMFSIQDPVPATASTGGKIPDAKTDSTVQVGLNQQRKSQ
jgi:conjugal transfer pilus assembly protein TraV